MLGGMNHEGPIITEYSPISAKGGSKRKTRRTRTRRTRKTRRTKTRRYR